MVPDKSKKSKVERLNEIFSDADLDRLFSEELPELKPLDTAVTEPIKYENDELKAQIKREKKMRLIAEEEATIEHSAEKLVNKVSEHMKAFKKSIDHLDYDSELSVKLIELFKGICELAEDRIIQKTKMNMYDSWDCKLDDLDEYKNLIGNSICAANYLDNGIDVLEELVDKDIVYELKKHLIQKSLETESDYNSKTKEITNQLYEGLNEVYTILNKIMSDSETLDYVVKEMPEKKSDIQEWHAKLTIFKSSIDNYFNKYTAKTELEKKPEPVFEKTVEPKEPSKHEMDIYN